MAEEKQMQFEEVSRTIDRIVDSSLEELMHSSMMPYSEYVILDRALPRVEDGMKPVQRRILYTMFELGLTPDKPYKKSARIVGDCLGKYHPHGDTSVYGAMVRMAQDFNMSVQLVDGHGNYGSVDGDSAAAMRYTEARLSPVAMEMLRDIDKDTVKWGLNFDDSMKEPQMLPSRFPNLLVNGASGIAIGLATNIPPHNLEEAIEGAIEYINNPKITLEEMMKIIKGPDFPTGGIILAGDGLKQAYETGNGKIRLRAKFNVEKVGDKHQIVITEIPYQVNKALLLTSIMELKEDKDGAVEFNDIQDVVDESDRRGMRAVIKLKKDADYTAIIKSLLAKTKLEVTFGINMVAIAEGRPQQLGLLPLLKYYVDYQRGLIYRRAQFDLAAAKKREEILLGLQIAIKNIDEVIAIIKRSSSTTEAKAALRERFELSELQANSILEMKLGRLTTLEINKLVEELKEVQAQIVELTSIVQSKAKQLEVVKKELKDIKKRFKTERRSSMSGEEASAEITVEAQGAPVAPAREGIIVLTRGGLVKLVRERGYQLAEKTIDKLDELSAPVLTLKLQENKTVFAFTNLGNCIRLNLDALPDKRFKEKGVILKAVCGEAAQDERIIKLFAADPAALPETNLYFFSREGFIKKSAWSEYAVAKDYYQAVVLKEGDDIINVEEEIPACPIIYVTAEGMCLNSTVDTIPAQGRRSQGVRGISLSDTDRVVYAAQSDGEGEITVITDKGYMKRVICATVELMQRYRKGVSVAKLGGIYGNKVLYAGYVKLPYDIAVFTDSNELVPVNTESMPIESRTGGGKAVLKDKIIKEIININI